MRTSQDVHADKFFKELGELLVKHQATIWNDEIELVVAKKMFRAFISTKLWDGKGNPLSVTTTYHRILPSSGISYEHKKDRDNG